MKAFSKILMLALILGLLVGTVFAIGAFAEEKATGDGEVTGDPTDPLWTPYGMITKSAEEVYTTDENGEISYIKPLAVFKKTGENSYEFDNLYGLFAHDSSADSALRACQSASENNDMVIYFLADATQSDAYHNTSNIHGNVTIDLNGHTFFYSNYLNAQAKSDPTKYFPVLTFKNGRMESTGRTAFVIAASTATKYSSANNVVFNFEKITFSLDSDTSVAPWEWILSTNTPSPANLENAVTNNTSYKKHSFTLNITDCIFDTRNLSQNTKLFVIGDLTKQGEPVVVACA